MALFMSSRFTGLHLQHLAAPKPAIQIVTRQNFSRYISTRILQSQSISISQALPTRALPKPLFQNVFPRRLRHGSPLPPRDRVRRARNPAPSRNSEPLPDYVVTREDTPPPRRNNAGFVLGLLAFSTCAYVTLSWTENPIPRELSKIIPVVPELKRGFLEDHFWLSQRNIDAGRYYTLLTNTFIHSDLTHLFFNMMAMVSCISMVTPVTFVVVWIGAGISASLFQLYTWKHRLPFGLNGKEIQSRFVEHRAGGASGSLFGIYAAMAIRNPAMKMMIMPIPVGIPAGVLLSAAIGFSLLAMREGWLPSIGHAGHLGGAAVGIVWGVASLAFRIRRV